MSGTNQKRCRKTKLVPRSYKDGDEYDKLQDQPHKKISKGMAGHSIQNDPTTSTYQPLQFDIKIEVEECDVDETIETTELIPESEIKTEIINENDLFEFEERDINSLLAQALSKKRARETEVKDVIYGVGKGNTIGLDNDHDYSLNKKANLKKQEQPSSVYHLQLDEEAILKSLDELCQGHMSLADTILSIEMRNLWGRCRMIPHNATWPENRIQIALNTWKYWKVSCRGGEVPLMYKCYVCEMAWWHLGPFQEHLAVHEEMVVVSESQSSTSLYNIVAYSSKSNHVYKDFRIDSNCWRCGYGYEHHLKTDTLYLCKHCLQTFQTCFKHRAHEAECVRKLRTLVKNGAIIVFTCHICNLKVLHKESLEVHYSQYHDVRSDLPMIVDVRTCMACSENYVSLPFHYCSKKNYSIMCIFCSKRFPSKIALDIHSQDLTFYPCTVCGSRLTKKCMLAEHMLKHTDKFKMLHKCLSCKDNVLLFTEDSMRKHKIIWHKQKVDKRRNYFEKVLVPRKFIEAQKLEGTDDAGGMTSSTAQVVEAVEEVKKNDMIEIEVKPSETEKQEIITIDLDDNPSTSIQIKQEVEEIEEDEEFEDLNDSIVKTKMLQEMQKNNNFAEDDEGYEYILSSVFNTSNSSMLEKEIAEEADDFEELINKELLKSNEQKPDQTSPKNTPDGKKKKQVKQAMVSKLKKVDTEKVKKVVKFRCDYQGCNVSTDDRRALKTHRKTHKVTLITCSKCDEPFTTFHGYLSHLTDHGYEKWACPECLRTYTSYGSLASHVRIMAYRLFAKSHFVNQNVGNNRLCVTYKCKKCGVTVPRDSILNHWEEHLVVTETAVVKMEHEEEAEIDVSSAVEHEEATLDRVADDVTPEIMMQVIAALVVKNKRRTGCKSCKACGRTFDRRNDCKRHHIEHLLANAYGTKIIYKGLRCQICFKVYERPDGYKHHMREHGNLPVYKCHLCFKTFSDSSNYVKHQKTHGSMYICDLCKKKFQIKASLIKHMQCHINVDPINCIFCPKKFYMESDFSRHVRSAHNQSLFKYSCIICKKKFKTTKDKWDHMWIQHRERHVKADCPVCSAEFRKVTDVKKHLKTEHGMEISVMNMKVFRDLLKNMKEGKEIDDEKSLVTVKNAVEDNKIPYVVVKSEDDGQNCQIFSKNDMLTLINNELLKTGK